LDLDYLLNGTTGRVVDDDESGTPIRVLSRNEYHLVGPCCISCQREGQGECDRKQYRYVLHSFSPRFLFWILASEILFSPPLFGLVLLEAYYGRLIPRQIHCPSKLLLQLGIRVVRAVCASDCFHRSLS